RARAGRHRGSPRRARPRRFARSPCTPFRNCADRVKAMKVLFIGDVVGGPGRRGLAAAMPGLRERFEPEMVIVNGENTAGGGGSTEKTANALFDAGADVITSGNHVYRHREVYGYLNRSDRLIRPANYPYANPGRGYTVVEIGGRRCGVINLSGAIG